MINKWILLTNIHKCKNNYIFHIIRIKKDNFKHYQYKILIYMKTNWIINITLNEHKIIFSLNKQKYQKFCGIKCFIRK